MIRHPEILLKVFSILAVLLLTACSGNTYLMKQVPYSEPAKPGKSETLIYVFREDSFLGSARKFAIINNDTVVGVLNPKDFTQFKVNSGENEVVAYIAGPLMHYRVQGRAGETVYLYCRMGYSTGIFMEEISKKQAREYMQTYNYTEIDVKGAKTKTDYREYYDNMYN